MWNRSLPISSRRDSRQRKRVHRVEKLEPRQLMAVDPIHLGVTYLETDQLEAESEPGKDSIPDRFILSFVGGAADTELTEIRISTDKDNDGLSIGDLLFDTKANGRGKAGFHDFKVVHTDSIHGAAITVVPQVEDGGTDLIIRLSGFKAGDLLEFSVDVDQILRLSPDLATFNSGLDVIASGQEFQDSIMKGFFEAPHFEAATADAVFVNDFGDPAAQFGLRLPPDEGPGVDSRPNRSAAAIATTSQVPKPISIAGTIWVDENLDLKRQANEELLSGVQLSLWKKDSSGRFVDTGLKQTTGTDGRYEFGTSLGLSPGEYQVVESQPAGLFSVGAVVGQVAGQAVGAANGKDILTGINISLGDTAAIKYDFAEARPAQASGFVYHDDNDDGRKSDGESGLAGVLVRLVPRDTIAPQVTLEKLTSADGSYHFDTLSPGRYDIVEVVQPAGLTDGRESVGTVNGQLVGQVDEPGDAIRGVVLSSNSLGLDYNFGELPLGSISGSVFLAAPGEDCLNQDLGHGTPLFGVVVELLASNGVFVARTTTGLDGQYRFDNVPKGIYNIIEVTPIGLLDGNSHVGTINGISSGASFDGGTIRSVTLPAGGQGIRYDFCEGAHATVSGFAYHDASNDGRRDRNEEPIANVKIELLNAVGSVVAVTQTAANGAYLFTNVVPGTYSIRETQPQGFLDGIDSPGTIAGKVVGEAHNPGDLLAGIVLLQGQTAVDYNFGELRTGSIAGRVHVDNDGGGDFDSGERLLSGVTIRLWDSSGREVATTTTNNVGRYLFEGVAPGNYTITEEQPSGYFEGGAKPGTAGGRVDNASQIGNITLHSGEVAVEYNFYERPPAEISGVIFVDQNLDAIRENNERLLSGVRVDLLTSNGNLIATTVTDARGEYRFGDLPEGNYTLRETQPSGLFQGGQTAGTSGGDDSRDDVIASIPIRFGDVLTQYNFYELEPSTIAGIVFVDNNENGLPEATEQRLSAVTIELYDLQGRWVANTKTNGSGQYEFSNLPHGQFRVVEQQPDGFFSLAAIPGSGGGRADGTDVITDISIGPGISLVEYSFSELSPSSISGAVWQETDLNRNRDPGDLPVAGVTVQLLNASGNVIATQQTDSAGQYRFDGLRPGVYAVRETQPTGLFHGGQVVGSLGGNGANADLISDVVLPAGVNAIGYDFPEFPPATIQGNVFQDGGHIRLSSPLQAANLRQFRDGVFTLDDQAIGGVVLELRNVLGLPFTADRALPGAYPDGPIRVVTAADGSYEFSGLRPGSYHVYQVQPPDFIDGLDTPGNTGGRAINEADLNSDVETLALVRTLSADPATNPRNDAILNISLAAGGRSSDNNFSEVLTLVEPPVIPVPPILAPPLPILSPPTPIVSIFERVPKIIATGEVLSLRKSLIADAEYPVTWHLSIINGGFPRGDNGGTASTRQVSAKDFGVSFSLGKHRSGRWALFNQDGQQINYGDEITLGEEDALPLAGDFNGDGIDEVAIFVGGQWFVDLNGNGIWDAADLWLRLGTKLDRPVVGDWDGDGKDDVGIFGPQWQRDPEVIARDPGLPDSDNQRRRNNLQPTSHQPSIADKPRLLQCNENSPLRADAIDHVFRYGETPDDPLCGDWNGDGIDSVAIFRAGVWMLDVDADGRWTKDSEAITFGRAGDKPIVGDWDGDGIDDLGVIRGDVWIIDSDGDRRLTGNDKQIQIPKPNDDAQSIVGDWDGDGKNEFGWYSRSE